MFSIVEAIRARVAAVDPALVQGHRSHTYAEVFEITDAIAAALRQHLAVLTHRPDRLRVGVHFPSGLDYVPIALATLAAGFCFVPIPDELAAAEKADLIQRTALDAVLAVDAKAPWLPSEARTLGQFALGAHTVQVIRLPASTPAFPVDHFEAINPAFIRFSSGTTGRSKGVLLSHESLLERITAANAGLQIAPGDRVLWVLPMAHHFAVSIILYLYFGATTVIEESHLGEDLLRAGASHHTTVMYGSPVHYRQLVEAPPVAEWHTLRLAISTAAALDAVTAGKFRTRFRLPLTQALGIIEVGLPLLNVTGAQEAPEALGLPLPAYRCSLNNELGQEPPLGEPGEIRLRGPGMFDAYLDPWTPRAEALDPEGWFPTGDLGRRDSSGRIYICGRKKNLINVGGMKVFPEEVERILDTHPGVQRSLVEARPHPLYGEIPIARYIPISEDRPTAKDLRAHCRAHLAAHKIPLLFTPVENLPLTPSGKLKRA